MSFQWQLLDNTFYSAFNLLSTTMECALLSSLTYESDAKIVDNSENDGSVELGQRRKKSPSFKFEVPFAFTDDTSYNAAVNPVIDAFYKTQYFYNISESKRAKVAPIRVEIENEKGTRKRSGSLTFRFELLEACWEDSIQTTLSVLNLLANISETVQIDAGYKQTFLLLQFAAASACDEIVIVCESNNQVSIIEDPLFGTTADILYMDNVNGTLSLGTDLDRKEFLLEGTGFFRLESGVNNVQFKANANCDVLVSYRKRYYE